MSADTSVSGSAGVSERKKKRSPHVGEALGNQTSETSDPSTRFAATGRQTTQRNDAKVFDKRTEAHHNRDLLGQFRISPPYRRARRAAPAPELPDLSKTPACRARSAWHGRLPPRKRPGNPENAVGKPREYDGWCPVSAAAAPGCRRVNGRETRKTQPGNPENAARKPGATAGGAR